MSNISCFDCGKRNVCLRICNPDDIDAFVDSNKPLILLCGGCFCRRKRRRIGRQGRIRKR